MNKLDRLTNEAVIFADNVKDEDWLVFSLNQRRRAVFTRNFPAYAIWDGACEKIRLMELILPPRETCH